MTMWNNHSRTVEPTTIQLTRKSELFNYGTGTKLLFLLVFQLLFSGLSYGQNIADKVGEVEATEGFFTYYFDEDEDKLWLRVDELNQEFLYANYLAAGVGSNDIGLDRSQQGGERVVYFEKRGLKLLLVQPNLRYIAQSTNELEKKSVREAFASSVLYGFPIEAEENGAFLIDLSPFLMRDAHGVTNRLRAMREGSYSLDKSRSVAICRRYLQLPKEYRIRNYAYFHWGVIPDVKYDQWYLTRRPSPFDNITHLLSFQMMITPQESMIQEPVIIQRLSWIMPRQLSRIWPFVS